MNLRRCVSYFSILLSYFFFISCEQKEETPKSENLLELSFQIDTVMMDVGEEIPFLQSSLWGAGVSPDRKTLLNFNTSTFKMEVYDLDSLKLKGLIPLEKEGPRGIGDDTYIPNLEIDETLNTYIFHFNEIVKIDSDWANVDFLRFGPNDGIDGYDLDPEEDINMDGFISQDGQYYISYYGSVDFVEPREGIAIVDIRDNKMRKVALPALKKLRPFTITANMENGGGTIAAIPDTYMISVGGTLYYSSDSFNEVFKIDMSTLEIEHKVFNSSLTENQKVSTFEELAPSREKYFEFIGLREKEVQFGPLHYDESRKMFWRFSSHPDKLGEERVLTLFDAELNQIYEGKVGEFEYGSFSFLKDGDYYQIVNLEDDMAVVRFKIRIN